MAGIEAKFELDPASKRSLYAAFKTMDQQANVQLKNEVKGLTVWMAGEIKTAAARSPYPNQAKAVAATTRGVKDRIPYVRIGGEKVVTKSGAKAGDLLFGSEFGGPGWFKNKGRRFYFRSGKGGTLGYWIYPTLRNKHDELTERWRTMVEKYVENPWGRNG